MSIRCDGVVGISEMYSLSDVVMFFNNEVKKRSDYYYAPRDLRQTRRKPL